MEIMLELCLMKTTARHNLNEQSFILIRQLDLSFLDDVL